MDKNKQKLNVIIILIIIISINSFQKMSSADLKAKRELLQLFRQQPTVNAFCHVKSVEVVVNHIGDGVYQNPTDMIVYNRLSIEIKTKRDKLVELSDALGRKVNDVDGAHLQAKIAKIRAVIRALEITQSMFCSKLRQM